MPAKKTAERTEKGVAVKISAKKAAALKKLSKKSANKASPPSALKKHEKRTKKENKEKVVRDSFTMPQSEYIKIAEIKSVCLKAKMHVKKSEVLRAGLKALAKLNATQLRRALSELEKIKTGRPRKH